MKEYILHYILYDPFFKKNSFYSIVIQSVRLEKVKNFSLFAI